MQKAQDSAQNRTGNAEGQDPPAPRWREAWHLQTGVARKVARGLARHDWNPKIRDGTYVEARHPSAMSAVLFSDTHQCSSEQILNRKAE